MTTINVPTSISRTKVLDFVRSLGINPNDAVELRVGVGRVELEIIARNEAGNYFTHPGMEMATHTISIDIHHDADETRDIGTQEMA